MTRKDYIKLAQIIKDNGRLARLCARRTPHVIDVRNQPCHVLVRGDFMNGLCQMLENDNPNFDERKFREATGEILGQ